MSLLPAEITEVEGLASDYRIGSLDVPARTRLVLLLAKRDGRLEAGADPPRIECALALPGCLARVAAEDAVIDHIVLESQGGGTVPSNLRVVCTACNAARLAPPA